MNKYIESFIKAYDKKHSVKVTLHSGVGDVTIPIKECNLVKFIRDCRARQVSITINP